MSREQTGVSIQYKDGQIEYILCDGYKYTLNDLVNKTVLALVTRVEALEAKLEEMDTLHYERSLGDDL